MLLVRFRAQFLFTKSVGFSVSCVQPFQRKRFYREIEMGVVRIIFKDGKSQ